MADLQQTHAIAVKTRGVDHLALGTGDMKKTMDFYCNVVGLKLVHVRRNLPLPDDDNPVVDAYDAKREERSFRRPPGAPKYDNIRHYFFDMGHDSLLGFFEFPPEAPRADRDSVAGIQHLAFHVSREEFEAARRRMEEHGVEYVGPLYLGSDFSSINFFDPNGIRLEVVTDLNQEDYDTVARELQPEEELRAELATLYTDPAELEDVLARHCLTRER
jgi:glyoxylase I family protein